MNVDPKTNLTVHRRRLRQPARAHRRCRDRQILGHFGAYGANPVVDDPGASVEGEGVGNWAADFAKGQMQPVNFRSPLHCAKLANDGLLYVCDRGNNRVQIFKAAEVGKPCANPEQGSRQVRLSSARSMWRRRPRPALSGQVNFSTDAEQTCLYVTDLTNYTIYAVNRATTTRSPGSAPAGARPATSTGRTPWPSTPRAICTPARWMARAGCRSSCATARRDAPARVAPSGQATLGSSRGGWPETAARDHDDFVRRDADDFESWPIVHRGDVRGRPRRGCHARSRAGTRSAGHLHQRRRPDLSGQMRSLSPARLDCAHVAAHIRGIASMGQVHPLPRGRWPDAALAYRQDRRHSEVPE